MSKNKIKTILWISVFAVAMAFIESSVVVYLRALYYPDGFDFPLKLIDHQIGYTEIIREFATLVMLISVSIIAARKNSEIFPYFIFSFAIWDIFYYVFLKAILGWPESLFTWDILFLIPVTWVGPVIGPVINSITMIVLALIILYFTEKLPNANIKWQEWLLLIIGSIIIIVSYIEDYLGFMLEKFSFTEIFFESNQENILLRVQAYVPENFSWLIYISGQLILIGAIILYYLRMSKKKH